jgi:hypothetical protein
MSSNHKYASWFCFLMLWWETNDVVKIVLSRSEGALSWSRLLPLFEYGSSLLILHRQVFCHRDCTSIRIVISYRL